MNVQNIAHRQRHRFPKCLAKIQLHHCRSVHILRLSANEASLTYLHMSGTAN